VGSFTASLENSIPVQVYVDVSEASAKKIESNESSTIASISTHPSYDPTSYDHNIALVFLSEAVRQTPATLPTEAPPSDGSLFTAYSWFGGSPATLSASLLTNDFTRKSVSGGKFPEGVFALLSSEKSSPGDFAAVFDAKGVLVGFTFNYPGIDPSVTYTVNLFDYDAFIQEAAKNSSGSTGTPSSGAGGKGTSEKGTSESIGTVEEIAIVEGG
jgi:hypothetical protein